jgi:hypothetical protein
MVWWLSNGSSEGRRFPSSYERFRLERNVVIVPVCRVVERAIGRKAIGWPSSANDRIPNRLGIEEVFHFAVSVSLPLTTRQPVGDFYFVAGVQVIDAIASVAREVEGNVIQEATRYSWGIPLASKRFNLAIPPGVLSRSEMYCSSARSACC